MHANYSRGQFRITPSVKKVIGFSEVPKKLAPVVQGGFFDWSALKMSASPKKTTKNEKLKYQN